MSITYMVKTKTFETYFNRAGIAGGYDSFVLRKKAEDYAKKVKGSLYVDMSTIRKYRWQKDGKNVFDRYFLLKDWSIKE